MSKFLKALKLLLAAATFLTTSRAWSIGVSTFPVNNQTTTYVIDASIAPAVVNVDLPSAANNARVQLPNKNTNACTLMAEKGNTGTIYFGGSTVTNSNGANEGWPLNPGEAYGSITTTNSNLIFVATDTAGNDVKVLCN